jgi:hypothetical protein
MAAVAESPSPGTLQKSGAAVVECEADWDSRQSATTRTGCSSGRRRRWRATDVPAVADVPWHRLMMTLDLSATAAARNSATTTPWAISNQERAPLSIEPSPGSKAEGEGTAVTEPSERAHPGALLHSTEETEAYGLPAGYAIRTFHTDHRAPLDRRAWAQVSVAAQPGLAWRSRRPALPGTEEAQVLAAKATFDEEVRAKFR